MHMAGGGGMHRGESGDARASCASPLGTPLNMGIKNINKNVTDICTYFTFNRVRQFVAFLF